MKTNWQNHFIKRLQKMILSFDFQLSLEMLNHLKINFRHFRQNCFKIGKKIHQKSINTAIFGKTKELRFKIMSFEFRALQTKGAISAFVSELR